MDFHTLPRRYLQALCKRNGIRANTTNAAMADALRALPSVEGIQEIRTAAPPPEVSTAKSVPDEAAVRNERHECPLPCGSMPQAATRKTEDAAVGDAPAPVDNVAISSGKRRTRRSKKSKAKVISSKDGEAALAENTEPVIESVWFDNKSADSVGNHNGFPLPRGGRGRVTRSKAEARETEDTVPARGTLQRTQKTEAEEALQTSHQVPEALVAVAHTNVEAVSTGKTKGRKSKRPKAKEISEQDGEALVAEQKEPVTEVALFDNKSAVAVEYHNGCLLPRGGRGRVTRSKAEEQKMEDAAPVLVTMQRTQKTEAEDALQMSHQELEAQVAAAHVNVEAVSKGKRRTRRSKRSKANVIFEQDEEAPAAEQKAPVTEPLLFDKKSVVEVENHNGCPIQHGGCGRNTRSKAAAHVAEDAVDQEVLMLVEMEELPTGKRRTRRSKRSKEKLSLNKKEEEPAMAERTELKADSSDAATQEAVISEKRRDDLKEESVINEESTKPQEGKIHCDNPSSAVKWTRRSRKQKVQMASDKNDEVAEAVMKELIADSCNGGIGSTIVSDKCCNDFNDEKVSLMEVRAPNFQQGIAEELGPTYNVQKSSSLVTMRDSPLPLHCVLSRAEPRGPVNEVAQDYSVKGGGDIAESPVDEIKMDPYILILTSKLNQSNRRVNTHNKFENPMYNFTVKKKKQGECWWIVM